MAKSTAMRPQPPSIRDPQSGEADLEEMGEENLSGGQSEGDEDDEGDEDEEGERPGPNWDKRMKDSYRFSTSYLDSNYRKQWEDSIRAFNNEHASDSKYASELFRKRSHIYRPKTRTVIRKNEAAAAAAFFSNLELISITPMNGSDKRQQISAELNQQLIQYRLTNTIPWFHIVQGGIQDAQVQGCALAHIYWEYASRRGKDGKLVKLHDRPWVELLPIENIRIDPSAHWYDPIGTSPYLIELIPMYYGDVKERMGNPDPKGRRWKHFDEADFRNSTNPDDATRSARLGGKQDPTQQSREISDYDIVWIHRHIHRFEGSDWEFYTIASEHLLSTPALLEESVFHGRRPYVMGICLLETHKPMPNTVPKLTEGIQMELNEVANQRLDNVKFVLNKRWIVKRGRNADLASLVRNVPGGITLADDPEKDIREVTWQDVTASAYQEQEVLNSDFDELAGNFSPNAVRQQRTPRESEGAMLQLAAPANMITEYTLKTFCETFVQPVVRQLVMLEQHYETDANILSIAGEKAQAYQKHGIDEVTDDLLDQELTTMVNVGMGATDPVSRLQRFRIALVTFQGIALKPPPGVNLAEVWKEIMALSGYKNGERFTLEDPDKVAMAKQIQGLGKMIQQLKMQQKDKHEANVVKLQTAREKNATQLLTHSIKEHSTNARTYAQHLMALEMRSLDPAPEAPGAKEPSAAA